MYVPIVSNILIHPSSHSISVISQIFPYSMLSKIASLKSIIILRSWGDWFLLEYSNPVLWRKQAGEIGEQDIEEHKRATDINKTAVWPADKNVSVFRDPTASLQNSLSKNCEKIHFHCFKSHFLLQQLQESWTASAASLLWPLCSLWRHLARFLA